ncbi:MAG: hypothetical protein ABIA93_02880 [Candidatus Woesearchaeota archaeon]
MANDDFKVMLDKRESHTIQGAELGGASLRGRAFFKKGAAGVAESIDEVISSGLVHVPTYALIRGRAFASGNDSAWNEWHDSKAERLTLYDESGILGKEKELYAVDIQNGGFFVWNPQRIRDAVTEGKLVNYGLQLEQSEVDSVLDAVKRKDYEGLKQILHGGSVAFAGGYDEFVEASDVPGFIKGVDTTYIVFRSADEARELSSGRSSIAKQRASPDLIIASGGRKRLGEMFDVAEKPEQEGGLGLKEFGAWNDGYKNRNVGRVVVLDDYDYGVDGNLNLYGNGRSVGVAPEALDAFYTQKDVDPVVLKVNQAMKTLKPVDYDNGVLLYVPSVRVQE